MAERTETFQGDARVPAVTTSAARERLGPYELLFPLGSGGMAEVWAAVRRGGFGFRQHFAVKTIRADHARSAAFREMFLEEARLASSIHHTNVVPVLDLGEEDGTVYQAMPLVEGASLAAIVAAMRAAGGEARVPLDVLLRIGIDVGRGLHAAHEARDDRGQPLGIVHRDVSPHNVLLGVDGVAKVADFGIAKAFGYANGTTETGAVKGKRAYLAPEQALQLPLDRRADVFALGVVLWELAAGRRLFESGDAAMYFQLRPRVDDVRVHDPAAPPAVAEAIARALSASADERWPTAESFADALEAAALGADVAPSARGVATLVEAIVGGDLDARRRDIEGATERRAPAAAAGPHTEAATATERTDGAGRREAPRATIAWIVAPAVAIVVLVGGVVAARVRVEPARSPAPATPPPAAAPEPPPSAPAPPPVAEDAPRAPAVVTPPARPSSPPPRGAGRPAHPPAKPKFDGNPYAR